MRVERKNKQVGCLIYSKGRVRRLPASEWSYSIPCTCSCSRVTDGAGVCACEWLVGRQPNSPDFICDQYGYLESRKSCKYSSFSHSHLTLSTFSYSSFPINLSTKSVIFYSRLSDSCLLPVSLCSRQDAFHLEQLFSEVIQLEIRLTIIF